MGHHRDSDGRFQSDKHDLPPDRVRLSLEVPENWPGLLLIANAYLAIDRGFGEDLRHRVLELQAEAALQNSSKAVSGPFDTPAGSHQASWTDEELLAYADIHEARKAGMTGFGCKIRPDAGWEDGFHELAAELLAARRKASPQATTENRRIIQDAYELGGGDCEHANCRVDATSVLVADEGPRHGQRHLALRARCEDCRRMFAFGDVLEKSNDGMKISIAMVAGKIDPTPQCATCKKDMPGVIASSYPVDCAACIAEARAIHPPETEPAKQMAGDLRLLVPPKLVHPGASIFGFMGWLTTREEKAGPFSGADHAGEAAELAGAYCAAQGWGDHDLDASMKMLQAGPSFTTRNRCGNEGECVGCRDCESPGA